MLSRVIRAANKRLTNIWPVKFRRGRLSAPVATITFDDFPRSAWTAGGSVLERCGVRGTYFVSAAFSPERLRQGPASGIIQGLEYYQLEDLAAAYEHGHEIGCHTFDHIRVPRLTDLDLEESIARNADFVRDCLGDVLMTSFSFPRGAVNIRTKRLFSKHFAVCRGTWPGMNSGWFDLSLLRTFSLDPDFDQRVRLSEAIQKAKATNAWIVFFTHDISQSPSPWGCTPQLLESVVSQLSEHGIEILPMKSALARAGLG